VVEPLLLLGLDRAREDEEPEREDAGRPQLQECAPAEGSPTASFSRPDRNGSRSSAT
jgi:hypothetical protein